MSYTDASGEVNIMTMTSQQNSLSRRQVLALRGLRLPSPALKRLHEAGIYCEPAISIEYQHLAKKYVIWGRESGGAVHQIGAYCGFVGAAGERLEWLTHVNSVGRNGIHATVVASSLVRVQAFRDGQTFQLLLTRHELIAQAEGRRPSLQSHVLFHGANGTFPVHSSAEEFYLPGGIPPEFLSRAGEPLLVPLAFQEAARIAIAGTHMFGCKTPQLLLPKTGSNRT
jgi:hypothetical protein